MIYTYIYNIHEILTDNYFFILNIKIKFFFFFFNKYILFSDLYDLY